MPLTPAVESAVERLADARHAALVAAEYETLAKAAVMELIGGFKGVHTPHGKVSWSLPQASTRTDWKGLATALAPSPEMLAQFTTDTEPSRTFRFTPAKED
jgi:hypothetical protein